MATRRDPIGVVLFWMVFALVKATGFQVHQGGAVPTEREPDPEPRWMLCSSCGHSTVHLPYFWVTDGDTDWECNQCGAVTYG